MAVALTPFDLVALPRLRRGDPPSSLVCLPTGTGIACVNVLSHSMSSSVSPGSSFFMTLQLAMSYRLQKAVSTVTRSAAVEPEISPPQPK